MERNLPAAGRPFVVIHQNAPDEWEYRWWNDGDAFILGEPATRTKLFTSIHGVLPALLSDAARMDLVPDVS